MVRRHDFSMQIRIALPADLKFIEGAYAHARTFMQANGNATQWPDGYPSIDVVRADVERGHAYVVADDEGPLAAFSFAPGPDETYAEIDGAWRSDADYHVIHRVAAVRGRSVARTIVNFAATRSDYLRCDTHEDNTPMRRALESFGFRECSTIVVTNGTERIAYDWLKDTPTSTATR